MAGDRYSLFDSFDVLHTHSAGNPSHCTVLAEGQTHYDQKVMKFPPPIPLSHHQCKLSSGHSFMQPPALMYQLMRSRRKPIPSFGGLGPFSCLDAHERRRYLLLVKGGRSGPGIAPGLLCSVHCSRHDQTPGTEPLCITEL